MPDSSDFLAAVVEALRARSLPAETIERYANIWRALPADAASLPCPFCFVSGKNGPLRWTAFVPDEQRFACGECKSEIAVRAPIIRISPGVLVMVKDELRKRGYAHSLIELFHRHWTSSPADADVLPCPFCFFTKRTGRLFVLSESGGSPRLRCMACGEGILMQ